MFIHRRIPQISTLSETIPRDISTDISSNYSTSCTIPKMTISTPDTLIDILRD
jgi:hypothetical protein